ncbi:MAG: rhomboid family intramembrane serine protease [Bacteroidetes bacterium]|nr:rhomboid family intramembrane serine protease [Bacteroidota bacterium]
MDIVQTIKSAPVASFIFGLTLATSLMDLMAPQRGIQARFILHPYSMVRNKQFYRLFSAGLVHGDWLHLFFNMFVFYNFAFLLEQVVGGLAFAGIYVVSLAVSSLPLVIKHKDNPAYSALGASGAIAGILFSFITLYPETSLILVVIPIKAWLFGILYLVFSYVAARQHADRIAHDAHFWGAIAGMLLTFVLVPGSWELMVAFLQWKLG